MEKRTFTLDSSDGKSKLSGFLFLPEGHPRAVVQICHGMCEYILRYEELAQHLTDAEAGDYIRPEPTRLRRISYAVFCLKKKTNEQTLIHISEPTRLLSTYSDLL